MKRLFLALALVAGAGCAESTEPTPLYSSYFLSTVDGKPLPVPLGADGVTLVANVLAFGDQGRPRAGTSADGMVRYILEVRRPDQSLEHSEIDLNYQIRGDELRIDLCPPLALCITTTELVGPFADHQSELVLTHHVAGKPMSVYRFVAAGSGGAK